MLARRFVMAVSVTLGFCVGCARVGSRAGHGAGAAERPVLKPLPTAVGEVWTNSVGMRFVRIQPGSFVMGSPVLEKERSDNEAEHEVRISRPFFLGVTHVTVGQFSRFTRESGHRTEAERRGWANGSWNAQEHRWNTLQGASWRNPGFSQRDDHPVVCVSWNDTVTFCAWLSATEGRKYRLPSEAEWEYACRAGRQTAYVWGDNPDDGAGWANCSDQTSKDLFTLFPSFTWSDGFRYTSPVATFKPNAWGLYDMLGNALQWCGDWFGPYPEGASPDPEGPATGKERILRGGSFVYGPRHCRCAFRGRNLQDFENFYTGFRIVLETAN